MRNYCFPFAFLVFSVASVASSELWAQPTGSVTDLVLKVNQQITRQYAGNSDPVDKLRASFKCHGDANGHDLVVFVWNWWVTSENGSIYGYDDTGGFTLSGQETDTAEPETSNISVPPAPNTPAWVRFEYEWKVVSYLGGGEIKFVHKATHWYKTGTMDPGEIDFLTQ